MPAGDFSRRTSTAIPTLSEQLQNAVPPCAQSCLSTYIYEGFVDASICTDSDLSCLCTRYSSYGFTLGELALVCLTISDCGLAKSPEEEQQEQQTAFGVCSAQSNAAQATHSVLDPPATTPLSTPRTTSAQTQPTLQPKKTSTRTSGGSASRSPSGSTLPTSSVAAASITSDDTQGGTGLTSAQAVGVSIGAVGFVVLVVAFAYVMVCIRRRKELKQVASNPSDDFGGDKPNHRSWFNFPGPGSIHVNFGEPYQESISEKRQTAWPSQHARPGYRQSHEKVTGARISMSRESCRSNSSIRTVSRLLPEKPSRSQLRPEQPERPERPERPSTEHATVQTPATVFEEDRFSIVPRPIPSLPKNPRQPQYAHQFTRSPEAVQQPSLSLDIPRQGSRSESIEAVGNFPLRRDDVPRPFYESSKAASSTNSFLKYYEGPDSGSPEDYYPYTPIDEHSQIRRHAPAAITITRPTFPPLAVRTSMASDASRRTSFESTDPDEPTPPDEPEEEEKRLTPVAESPIASIRYPKIPRGSNQAVPRSPPQQLRQPTYPAQRIPREERRSSTPEDRRIRTHSPSLSGSTLAAKRLGDHAAHNLERGLRITPNGTPSHEHSKQREDGIPREYSPANWPLPSQEPLKSPLWEPKLTPRRMGGDLYLSVSVATPKHTHFPER